MSTSELLRAQPGSPRLLSMALEALGLALAFGLFPADLQPHPAWLVVLVPAARYGARGLCAGLSAAGAVMSLGAMAGPGLFALWSGLRSVPNLAALWACLAVAWVASGHHRREEALRGLTAALSRRTAKAEEAAATLRAAGKVVRARADQAHCSLSFLRSVAARLDGSDPAAAAEAAAELALARSGASCAVVVTEGAMTWSRVCGWTHASASRGFLAVMGEHGSDSLVLPDPRGADLSVPIPAFGAVVGHLTLWGVQPAALTEAAAHDLDTIALWLGSALGAAGLPATGTSPSASEAT